MSDGVLDRALRVMDCFGEGEPVLTAAAIAERTGLAISTLHRLLAVLVEQGLLMRARGRTYAIGARLWELGELSLLSLRLRETALPHMARLYEVTGENVHLAVLDGRAPEDASVLYIGRMTGKSSFPTITRTGSHGPLHTTGVGKAILAARDEPWLARYFTMPLEGRTVNTLVTEQAVRDDIARTRAQGYAVAREEMTLGNASIAVALPAVDGLPSAALGVVVRLDRADEARLAPYVFQAVRELHHELRSR